MTKYYSYVQKSTDEEDREVSRIDPIYLDKESV